MISSNITFGRQLVTSTCCPEDIISDEMRYRWPQIHGKVGSLINRRAAASMVVEGAVNNVLGPGLSPPKRTPYGILACGFTKTSAKGRSLKKSVGSGRTVISGRPYLE